MKASREDVSYILRNLLRHGEDLAPEIREAVAQPEFADTFGTDLMYLVEKEGMDFVEAVKTITEKKNPDKK